MYDELITKLLHSAYLVNNGITPPQLYLREALQEAVDAIEELQATLCNWCAVCPEDKRDLSTCEIYESCRAKQQKEK